MDWALHIEGLSKRYGDGFQALKQVDLTIRRGEIFALLGPNGAGKTTLIGIVCGIVTKSSGSVRVNGHDVERDYRLTRRAVGLVPQELIHDVFESVESTLRFSRGLFGKPANPALIERILRALSLWDKRHSPILTLSGGMKRRVMIAKALAHEPDLLFLDEPSAGVDVELRRDMWQLIGTLRDQGVTIVLTTHYIEEAEQIADRIGIIRRGEIILVEKTATLMQQLGKKRLTLHLQQPLDALPATLQHYPLQLTGDGTQLIYTFDSQHQGTGIGALLRSLNQAGIDFRDLRTEESSLEEIFVNLIQEPAA